MNQMVRNNGMVKTDQQFPIFQLPGRPPFMLARDVAAAYGVEGKQLNQARERNPKKFLEGSDYFQLVETEVTKCDLDWRGGHLPFGYSKRGAYMFATILSTDAAVEMAIRIVEGFLAFEHAGEKVLQPGHVAVKSEQMIDLQNIYIERLELQSAGFAPRRGLPWSEADIQTVFAMKAKGKSNKVIGEHFGRSKDSVDKLTRRYKKQVERPDDRQPNLFN
jgi:hypothetical protein